MKKSDRYSYVRVPRSDDEGNRTYDVGETNYPASRLSYHGPRTRDICAGGRQRSESLKLKSLRTSAPSEELRCTSLLKLIFFRRDTRT